MLSRSVAVRQAVRRVPPTRGHAAIRRSSPSPGSSAASPEIDGCCWASSASIAFEAAREAVRPDEFLSPYGLRAISAFHRDNPYVARGRRRRATVDYEPAESTTDMFGGNSNWRGPIWFPLNYLVIGVLERYRRFFGDDFTIEYPTGSGKRLTLDAIADDLWDRLISIFLVGPDGRRPCFGWVERLQNDPNWKDNLVFSEYFHGDNGGGPGRLAPDRMDRDRGRRDPPPARGSAVHRRRHPDDRHATDDRQARAGDAPRAGAGAVFVDLTRLHEGQRRRPDQ